MWPLPIKVKCSPLCSHSNLGVHLNRFPCPPTLGAVSLSPLYPRCLTSTPHRGHCNSPPPFPLPVHILLHACLFLFKKQTQSCTHSHTPGNVQDVGSFKRTRAFSDTFLVTDATNRKRARSDRTGSLEGRLNPASGCGLHFLTACSPLRTG